MKKVLTIFAFIFLSSQSMADHFEIWGNYRYQSGTSTLKSELVESKNEAYRKGHNIMSSLDNQQSYDLRRILRVPSSRLDVRSIRIDDSFVTVQEISRTPGKVEYQALINVSYHYRDRDSND
jgi:hypothetical protein